MALDLNMLSEHLSYLNKKYEEAVYNEKPAKELKRITDQINLITELIEEYNQK
jgi:hypothetical protein